MNNWDAIDFEYKNYEVGGKTFRLTYADTHIRLNDVSIAYQDINQVRSGVYPPYRARGWTFSLELRDQAKQTLKVEFHCGRISQEKLEHRLLLWENIMRITTLRVLNPLVLEARDEIRRRGSYAVGDIELTRDGVNLRVRRWLVLRNTMFVPWTNAVKRDENDWLRVGSNAEPSVEAWCSPRVWNSLVMRRLLDYLWQDGGLAELTMPLATKNP